ncbi:hypothetical protein ACJQWK_04970 [Exserohilum turcicum]
MARALCMSAATTSTAKRPPAAAAITALVHAPRCNIAILPQARHSMLAAALCHRDALSWPRDPGVHRYLHSTCHRDHPLPSPPVPSPPAAITHALQPEHNRCTRSLADLAAWRRGTTRLTSSPPSSLHSAHQGAMAPTCSERPSASGNRARRVHRSHYQSRQSDPSPPTGWP